MPEDPLCTPSAQHPTHHASGHSQEILPAHEEMVQVVFDERALDNEREREVHAEVCDLMHARQESNDAKRRGQAAEHS